MNSRKHLNPFVLGGVVTGKQFAGRSAEVARLRAIAEAGQHVFLFAPRRYGKTSLLREALDPEATSRRLLLVWCDCLPTVNEASLTKRLAEAVVRASRAGRLTEWAKEAAKLFRRLRPTVTAGPGGEVSATVELGPPGSKGSADLEDALEAVGALARGRGKPVAVVFDEFQQMAEWDPAHHTEAVIRTVIQHQRGVAYCFAGSQHHLLQRMFTDRARPLFKLAAPFPLGRLSDDELEPWLQKRFLETDHKLEPAALQTLLGHAEGHPWAAQFLAYFVWEAAMAAGEAVVDAAGVERGLAEALRVGETIYARDATAVTPPQRRVLTAIARESTTTATAAGYIARHELPAKSTVAQALGSLIEKGYVEAIGDLAVVSDPLFAEWLRRR